MKSRWMNLCVTVVLILMLLSAGIVTWAAPNDQDNAPSQSYVEQGPIDKIESTLQTALDVKGRANMFIVFPDKPDLSPAYSMSWDERGKFVYETLRKTAEQSQAKVRAWLDAENIPYQAFIIDNSIYIPNA